MPRHQLFPAGVRSRLDEARPFFMEQGAVTSRHTGAWLGQVEEVAAQAVVHGQRDLALALCLVISEIEKLEHPLAVPDYRGAGVLFA